MIQSIDSEWKDIVDKFESSKQEIERGLDCYALDDYAGCVFHMMRIAELGLRSIAGERGVTSVKKRTPIEYAMWHDVFVEIGKSLEVIRNKSPGPNRDAARSFYGGALSDLRFLQGYRDQTMHYRESYGRGEAYDAIYRVKALMANLAKHLSEGNDTPIDWGL